MRIAKWIVVLVALSGCGGFIADFLMPSSASQHIFNPAWPPHAKFHDAQAILMGIGNATVAIAMLFHTREVPLSRFFSATAIAGMYWFAALLGELLPGTAWTDPEFEHSWPHPLGLNPQQLGAWIAVGFMIVAAMLVLRGKHK